jgi:hypothetical protein
MGLLLLEVAGQAAALDHEAGHDTVKHRAIKEAFVHIAQEIGHGLGCVLGIEFHREAAVTGLESNHDGTAPRRSR